MTHYINFNLAPKKDDRWFLQPIDLWVRRIVQSLNHDPEISDQKIANWIVETSEKVGINPELCNQGIWYFGAKVAESDFILQKSLHNIDYAGRF